VVLFARGGVEKLFVLWIWHVVILGCKAARDVRGFGTRCFIAWPFIFSTVALIVFEGECLGKLVEKRRHGVVERDVNKSSEDQKCDHEHHGPYSRLECKEA